MTFADWFFDKLKGHKVLPAFCTDTLDKPYKNDILKMRKILEDSFYQRFMKFSIKLT